MRRIKIAQIGIGHAHAGAIWETITRRSDVFEVVGYVQLPDDVIPEEKELKYYVDCAKLNLQQVLDDPSIEAVTIETDERVLCKYTILAAQAGKHIHMDKPGGLQLQEFEEMINLLKQKNLVFSTGYMYRHNPEIQKLIKEVKNGELGTVVSVEAQMDIYHMPEVRESLSHMPGGNMFFLGCHMVDLVLQLQGLPQRVYPFNKASGLDGVTTKDCCMAVLEYPTGYSYVRAVNSAWGAFTRRSLTVSGDRKTVELKPLEQYIPKTRDLFTGRTDYIERKVSADNKMVKSELIRRYDRMMEQFAKYITGEAENPYTYDYELALYKTVLQCCGDDGSR